MKGSIMVVNSASTTAQNSTVFSQQQEQVSRSRETENNRYKEDVASRPLAQKVDVQKAVEQRVVVEKQDAQRVDANVADEKKAVVQNTARPSVNTSGQVVGSLIDTQA